MATELVAIELNLRGADGVFEDLQRLDNMLKGFSGAKGKKTIELDLGQSKQRLLELKGEMNLVTKSIDDMRRKLKELKAAQKDAGKGSAEYNELGESIKSTTREIDNEVARLKELQDEFRDVTQRVNELKYALRNFSQMSFGQIFKTISTGLKHAGQNLQTLGNTLTRIGNPFQQIMNGAVLGTGYKLLNLATDGLSAAFDRYDTMKKYPLMMQQLGLADADTAEESVRRLSDAVDGLPTSLDEIVSMTQRFTLALGDMQRGEKLATAANNAFLASMSTETQQYQGMMQLSDLAAGKMLNEREWNSLITSMTAGINEVGKGFGYTSDNMDEFLQKLRGGDIPVKEFLDKLIEVGVGKDSALGQMAEMSKVTWEALRRNTRTAFARMGEGILNTLDEVSQKYNGKTILQNLLAEKGVIDQWSASIQGWIKAHPDEIIDFFNQLKQIDFAGLGRGMLDGLKAFAEVIKFATGAVGSKGLHGIGYFLAIASPLGKFLTLTGGLLKGMSHPLAVTFAAIAKGGIMALGEVKKHGLLGTLTKLLGGAKAATTAAETVSTAETVAEAAPTMGKALTGLSKVFVGWAEVAAIIGGTALVGVGTFKAFKTMMKDLGEMIEIAEDIDWGKGATVMLGMADFIAGFAALGTLIGTSGFGLEILGGTAIAGAISALVSFVGMVDMMMLKKAAKDLNKVIGYINSAIDGLNQIASVDDVGSVTDKASKAVDVFNQITDLFTGRNNPVTGETEKGLKGFSGRTKKSMSNLTNTISNMKTAIDTLNELGKMDIDSDGIDKIVPKMHDALSALESVILGVPSYFKKAETVEATGNLTASIGNLKGSLDALVGDNGILAQIPKIVQQMSRISRDGSVDKLPGTMESIGKALKQAYDALNSGIGNGNYMATNLDNFRQALKSAKWAVKHLQELGGMTVDDSVVTNIKNIFEKIKEAFNENDVTAISDTIKTFHDAIKQALDAFNEFNTDIEISPTIKLSSAFQQSVDRSAKQIRGAKGDIYAALNSIPSSYTKRITVKIIAQAVVSGMGAVRQAAIDTYHNADAAINGAKGNATGGRISRNGVLYRSGGGSIFKPRGTDKIPAMLTEGEYVTKKQATDFWGLDFMRKVNAMDVRGAMESMLTRAGTSIGVGRQSIVNHTVNNNQRITQNINTNNPHFAGVRLGRFSGAL